MKCGMCNKQTKRQSGLCEQCEKELLEELEKQHQEDMEEYLATRL